MGATSVGLLGISLGGSSVLNASHLDGAGELLDGGILAVSPPAVPEQVWARLSEPVSRRHPRYPLHRAFKAALISRVRSGRWPPEAEDMERVMEYVSAPYYGVSAEEIWRRANGRDHVPEAKVPLLVLHPEDDQIVKVEQARILERGGGRQRPGPRLDPAGRSARPARGRRPGLDPRRLPGLLRALGAYAERPVELADGASAEVVYSAAETG